MRSLLPSSFPSLAHSAPSPSTVIGSIEAVRNSIDDLARHDFSIVIVDEAHRVKNPYSNTTKALHQFSTNLRYGLTGTAVQNRLSEFWCILNWCAPGKVGTLKQWCVSLLPSFSRIPLLTIVDPPQGVTRLEAYQVRSEGRCDGGGARHRSYPRSSSRHQPASPLLASPVRLSPFFPLLIC